MTNQENQGHSARPGSSVRVIERLPAVAALGFRVDIHMRDFGHFQGSLVDFNATSLAVDITELAGMGHVNNDIEGITVTHGSRVVRSIARPKASIRQKDGQWRLIVFLNQPERQAAERRHTRIKTRDNFKPVVWVADPLYISRVINFQVENLSADGLQLKTSLSNKHILVGSRLDHCQMLLPGVGTLTVHLVICDAFVQDEHLVFGCLFHSRNKQLLEMLAQYAILGGDGLPIHLSQRKELLRAAGFTTRALAKPCTIKVAETPQDVEQILTVRFLAYQAAAKTPQGATSAMMQDAYDASAMIYCAKYGPEVIATMRANLCQQDGLTFPFEQHFGTCERLGIVRHTACEVSRLAILPAFQGSDLFLGFVKVTVQLLVQLGLEEMFCVATNRLSPLYQKIGGERISPPVRHPVLRHEFLTLHRIRTSSFLTGSHMAWDVWTKIAEEAIHHGIYHGFLKSATSQHARKRARRPVAPSAVSPGAHACLHGDGAEAMI